MSQNTEGVLLERVTDQHYGILNGQLRHLPGGVDEYLQIKQQQHKPVLSDSKNVSECNVDKLGGAECRAKQKEIAAIERRLEKLNTQVQQTHEQLAEHDQTDYVGLQKIGVELWQLETEASELEECWLELSDLLE